jgi:hypothetical protein
MHSVFLSACEGGGLALAAGCLVGAAGRFRRLGLPLAGAAGAIVFAAALAAGDHPIWAGVILGLVLAALAHVVTSGIAAGAAARAGEGSLPTISAVLIGFAVLLAVLSLIVPPIAIAALALLVFLAVARRRRAARKYAGLRVLR